jgi:hypothetical protein
MMISLLSAHLALAALPTTSDVLSFEAGAFVVAPGNTTLNVSAVGIPRGIGILPEFRACRVQVKWDAKSATAAPKQVGDCHPNLVDEVEDALSRWQLTVSSPPAADRTLLEIWYVFPAARGGAVRLYVRQAWDTQLTIRAPEIDVLQWGIKGLVPIEYPAEAATMDTQNTTCEVKVEIAQAGTPGGLQVSGCDPVFVPAVEQGLERWRFHTESIDGVPTWSAVTLAVRFSRSLEEGGPVGTALVLFPPDPDLGERSIARVDDLPPEREPRPDPTWPARFVVDHKSFAQVAIYDWRFPDGVDPAPVERTCDVLFGVNSKRVLWAWTETCDESVRKATEEAANLWILKPGKVVRGEHYARFRATFVFPPDGAPVVMRIPRGDLVTPPGDLPDRFTTYAEAEPIRRVPPELPRGFATEVLEEQVVCELVVDVSPHGAPTSVTVQACPPSYAPFAESAVKKWRWTPAEQDGKSIASRERVNVRFQLPGSAAPVQAPGG